MFLVIDSGIKELVDRINSIFLKIGNKAKFELFDDSSQVLHDYYNKYTLESLLEKKSIDFQQDTAYEESEFDEGSVTFSNKILRNNKLIDLCKVKLKADIQLALENVNLKDNPTELIRTDLEYLQELKELEKSFQLEGQSTHCRKSNRLINAQAKEQKLKINKKKYRETLSPAQIFKKDSKSSRSDIISLLPSKTLIQRIKVRNKSIKRIIAFSKGKRND